MDLIASNLATGAIYKTMHRLEQAQPESESNRKFS
jgi:hypothetical protein